VALRYLCLSIRRRAARAARGREQAAAQYPDGAGRAAGGSRVWRRGKAGCFSTACPASGAAVDILPVLGGPLGRPPFETTGSSARAGPPSAAPYRRTVASLQGVRVQRPGGRRGTFAAAPPTRPPARPFSGRSRSSAPRPLGSAPGTESPLGCRARGESGPSPA
jgi:hypothetical protein